MSLRRARLVAAALIVLAPAFVGAAEAKPSARATRSARWRPPVRQDVSVTVEDPFGRPLQSVRHGGRMFVAGEQGQRYAIRIRNNTARRVEVVASVDGRDVVSGRIADFARDRGYVVEPFGTVVIDGFRTSLQDVAAFRFSSVGESYSARRGTPQHAGVIGVAVFREHRPRPVKRRPIAPRRSRDAAASSAPAADAGREAPSGGSASRSKRSSNRHAGRGFARMPHHELGTGFGEQRMSEVVQVRFRRHHATRPDFTTTMHYDTTRGLAARGIPIEPTLVFDDFDDDAWPAARDRRFAPPPSRR